MKYRITKECGVGWDDPFSTEVTAWGVSESQHRLAKNVLPGDILLHYIDHANAWAGFSEVTASVQKNHRDTHADWLAALPYVISIERRIWLEKGQCEQTVQIPQLSHKHFNRQVTFTSIQQNDGDLIIEAINAAKAVQPTAVTPEFDQRWKKGAENYYKGIVKVLACGKCCLCKMDAVSWATQMAISIPENEAARIRDAFLDAAHIVAHSDNGLMTPDNLRGLCPNCHRVVDRLSYEQRKEILGNTKQ